MSFEDAVVRILVLEGGYVDHPADRGGPTKYGISQAAHPNIDVKNITLQDAKELYYLLYWKPLELDRIDSLSRDVALELFEEAVNLGVTQATKVLQRALFALGESDVNEDGIYGPVTKRALLRQAGKDPECLIKVLNGEQYNHYKQIIGRNPSQAVFFRGWMRRLWERRA